MEKLHYQIASWPDEEVVVAEILLGDSDVGHVAKRGDKLLVTIYRQGDAHLAVDMDDLVELLEKIRHRLS